MLDLYSSIRLSSIWVILRLVVSMTIGVVITTFIIRSLSVEEYGIYIVLYSLIGYVSAIASFGIPEVFRRFIPEALQKKEYSLLKHLVLRGLMLRVLLSALTVGIILLLHEPIGRLLKLEDFIDYFSIFAFGVVLFLEVSLLTSVLHSLFLHKYSVIAGTIYTLFRGVCVFVLLNAGWGIQGVLWAEVVSWGLWTALQWFFYYNQFVKRHPSAESPQIPLRRYARYAGLSSLNELGSTAMGASTDYFIISAFLGPSAVAIYAFSGQVIKLLMNCMPHIVLIDVIRPTFFTKYAESGRNQHLNEMFNLLVKIGAFFVFPLAAGIFVLGDKMITFVFKPDYLSAEPILWIIMVFTAINIFSTPASLVLQAVEQVQINLYSKVFAIFNVAAALLVIERFGVMGVVLTSCLSGFMKNFYCYWFARKYAELSIDWCGLFKISCNALGMALLLWFLRPYANNFFSLALLAAISGLFFLLVSWANKAFNIQERAWINRIVPMRVFVF